MTNREKLAAYKLEIAPLPEADGGGYQALYPQLARTVVGYGETPAEALVDLHSAAELLLLSLQPAGDELAEPDRRAPWSEFSGRVTLRVAKSLHYRLDRLADAEGVSLNALLSDMLRSGATALEVGFALGGVSPGGQVAGEVLHESAEMRTTLDGFSARRTWSSSWLSTSEWLDPVRGDGDRDFEFRRLVG